MPAKVSQELTDQRGSPLSYIQAFLHCRLDYCNSALAGVAKVYLQKLQSVQNMAAHMVTGACRCDRITPILEDLHWLPVSQRVVFKTALVVWNVSTVLLQPMSATSA